MQRTITIAISFLLSGLLGCNEQPPELQGDKKSGLSKATKTDWLDLQNDTEPALWLLAREKANGSSTDLRTMRQTLATASIRFGESSRMIANRAVQLEKMLQPLGGRETAVFLVVKLTSAVDAANKTPGFGTIGEYYYNLRKAGFTGQQALEDLSKHYGKHD